MDNPIEEIKRKIDIVDYIGSLITLKKVGRNFKGLCPFHQEKTPSFIVSPDRQIWHCFGACNEGGDVIKFLMKWDKITFIEALRELAKKTGVVLKKIDIEDKTWKKRERFFHMNYLAMEFFNYLLMKNKIGEKAFNYLKKRQIKEEIIKKFNLGYAPDSRDSLKKFLKAKKFTDEEIYENGLIIKTEKNNYYDRFRKRLIFPIKDSRGNVIAFSGRILEGNEKEAKYINSPETPIYHKRETLFGIDLAKDSISKEKNVYIVEGEFDMIMPYQFGLTNVVAIKGTALTYEQLMLLKRYTSKITLLLDADVAGEESTKRSIEEAEKLDLEIMVVRLTIGKDPDEAIKKDFINFKKNLKNALPVYDYLINSLKEKYSDETSYDKKKFADEILPFIEKINNPIVKSFYIKKISNLLDVSEKSIEEVLRRMRKKNQANLIGKSIKKLTKEDREILIEKYIISYIFQNDKPKLIFEKLFQILKKEYFKIVAHQKLIEKFQDFTKKNQAFSLKKFINTLEPEIKEVFDEIYLFASFEVDLEMENLEKLCYEIKKNYLKRQIKEILEKGEENSQQLIELNQQLKEVEKRLIK